MEIRATLARGQNSTQQMLKQHGDEFICVRYRHDKPRRNHLKTIEIIIDEQDWAPGVIFPMDNTVPVKIGFGKTELRQQMKQAGAYWNAGERAWMLSSGRALQVRLEGRVVDHLSL